MPLRIADVPETVPTSQLVRAAKPDVAQQEWATGSLARGRSTLRHAVLRHKPLALTELTVINEAIVPIVRALGARQTSEPDRRSSCWYGLDTKIHGSV
jgi:hypothetical protein